MHVTIDFETRSAVDLKRCGASVYARHPSTEVLCMAWAWNGESYLWHPSLEPPRRLFELIARGEPVEAHNAFFEQCIWQHVCVERLGWPAIAPEQWRCSMAACSRLALPRSLEDAGKALGLSIRKDKEGAKVMLRLCRIDPAQPASLFDQSHELPRLYAYCRRDVDSEIAISQAIEPLPERELAIWRLDQRINHRGIPIDRDAVTHALAIVDAEYEASSRQLQQLTGGAVDTPKSVKAMMSWIEARCGRCPPDLSAASVESWLGTEAMDDRVRAVLEIRRDCALSSPAKLQAMLDRCDGDGRVRGNLMYHGAAPGRWSGMGIQIQNFPRGTLKPYLVDAVHELLSLRSPRAIDLLVGSPIRSMASSLRSMIRAETGKRLLVCDFSQIEARVLAWLAGQEDLVALFAADGLVYEEMASRIYDVPVEQVTQEQRFIGKTSVLGCGYGMGAKAFQQACRLVGKVEISLRFARTVIAAYRQANDRIKQLWADLNQACIDAVGTKETVTLGRLVIRCDGVWMRIRLPAGRELHYREPRIESVEAPWSRGWTGWIGGPESMAEELEERGIVLGEREGGGWVDCDIPPTAETADLKVKSLKRKTPEFIEQISYMSVNSQTKKWQRERTYGGKLVENVVQATARDFLADAMLRVEAAGYPIIATVHDEIISEASDGVGSLAEFETLMREVPPWGSGCPIDVEGYEAEVPQMTRVIERNIEEAFVAYASSKGCLPLKLRIDGSNGWPDRTVITPTGKALFIEFKRPGGGSLSASQRRWLTLLEMRGFATLVADDLRQATAFLDRHL